MTRPLVIAHRGASAYEAENSMAAFRAAAARGADGVELDVHGTADGGIVVHHDEVLSGGRAIADLSLDAVRTHRLANGEAVPTLQEALAAIDPGLAVFVEVKSLSPRHDDALLAALAAGPNPAGYAVHGFDHRVIQRLGQRRPDLPRGVLSASYPLRPLAPVTDAGVDTLWQERTVVDQELVTAARADDVRVIVWTVNREPDLRRVVGLGVHGVVTNYPDVARRVVDRTPE